MSEVCPTCGEDPETGYRCQKCGKDLVGSETEESEDLMADGGYDYYVRISAPDNPEQFAVLIDSLEVGDEVVWNGRSEPFTVTAIPVDQSLSGIGRFERRLVLENQTRENGAEFRLWFDEGSEDHDVPFASGTPARCVVQRQIGENGNSNGWGRTTDVESLAHVNPVEAADRDSDREVAADGGTVDLEGLSTHDLVGKALEELGDQEADNGIPKQDVVRWVTSRTELVSHDVHDAIGWLNDNGEVYEPRPDRLQRTETDSERWLAVAWHTALVEVHAEVDLDPKYLADRYDAETPDEVDQLVEQGAKEVIRSDNNKLTLDDLDEAEEKLEESGFEVMTDGGVNEDLGTIWYVVAGPQQDPARVVAGPFEDAEKASRSASTVSDPNAEAQLALMLVHNIRDNDYSVEWADGVERPAALVATDGEKNPHDPEWAFRSAVAVDYIKDAQRQWNSLSPEERHGSLEMARWVLEDAEYDEIRGHDFYDESLQPSSDIYRDDRIYDKCKWERAWGEFNAALHADRDSNGFLEMVGETVGSAEKEVLDDIIEVFDEIAEKHNVETFDECWNGEVEECDDHAVVSGTEQPEVVCLCGSTRFKDEYRAENRRLTMEGKIVLSVGLFGHADGHEFTDSEKQMLDDLHKQKINLADRIHVINVDGYIGDSTQSEIEYARETGTEITYLEQPIATDGGAVEDGAEHEQRFAFWLEPENYYRATSYDDGDINLELTEDQAESLIERLEDGIERISEGHTQDTDADHNGGESA